jgi:hypothetical protein
VRVSSEGKCFFFWLSSRLLLSLIFYSILVMVRYGESQGGKESAGLVYC